MSLYQAPFPLKPFQIDLVAKALSQPALLMGADCGMGKTIMSICEICLLLEDGYDHVLLECEKDKMDEWIDDLQIYTTATVGVLKDPDQRKSLIANLPQIILGSYETVRSEVAKNVEVFERGKRRTRLVPGPLTEALVSKNVILIWDEATAKIGAERGSAMYKHHELLVKQLRKGGGRLHITPLTASITNRDPIGWFNLVRLMDPEAAGTVENFEIYHVDRNKYGKAVNFKCLTPDETPPGVLSLQEKYGHLMVFKSKQDSDVSHYFPKVDPDSAYVVLDETHQAFYEAVAASENPDREWQQQIFGVLRQIAGHPLSLVRSVENAKAEKRIEPQVASLIVREVGEAGLAAMGSAKLEKLVEVLRSEVRGAQAVIFTFYGQSILPLIQERLVAEGFDVVVNHGSMSRPQKRKSRQAFRDGCQIFLSSDSGARGINLPQAQWVINYELPLTHASWWQRINRANRLDSTWPMTYVKDLVVKSTVEEGIVALGLKRHAWTDDLVPDNEDGTNYLSSSVRKQLMKISRQQAA